MPRQAPGSDSAHDYAAVVASDTVNFVDDVGNTRTARGIYVGVTGDVVAVTVGGEAILFTAAPVGILPIQAVRINATNTDATNMVALF